MYGQTNYVKVHTMMFQPQRYLIYFFCMATTLAAQQQPTALLFERLTQKNGLSQSSVQCMLQDSRGFMWFGTQDGLNRWDGNTMKVYRSHPGKKDALQNSDIQAITEDARGNLWIGTQNGLYRFDRITELFSNIQPKIQASSKISVTALVKDKSGKIWVGSYHHGLFSLDPMAQNPEETFTQFKANANDPSALHNQLIWRLTLDERGDLWIATYGGMLHKMQQNTNKFIRFSYDSLTKETPRKNTIEAFHYNAATGRMWIGRDESGVSRFAYLPMTKSGAFFPLPHPQLKNIIIRAIYEDKLGKVWIGTTRGLFVYELSTGYLSTYTHEPNEQTSLANDAVLSIYEDRAGTIWVGTDNGASFVHPSAKKFTVYRAYNTPRSLASNNIWSLLEDKSGTVWVGTDEGLSRLDAQPLSGKNEFTTYRHDDENPRSLSHDLVSALYETKAGVLWVGTNGGGLNRFERSVISGLGEFRSFIPDPDRNTSLSNEFINTILEDKRGRVWVGTAQGLNRLESFDAGGEAIFRRYLPFDNASFGVGSSVINTLLEDKTGTLWIGTIIGLLRYNPKTDSITAFTFEKNKCYVLSLCEDKNGNLWVGTYDGGLKKFNHTTLEYTETYTVEDGLPNNTITGIVEDSRGFLWLSTNKGLSRFEPLKKVFRNYDERDGLQSDEFNQGAFAKGQGGLLYFGGGEGFNVIKPTDVKDNQYIPQLVLTDFTVLFDRTYKQDSSIIEKRHIELPYDKNYFVIKFASLSYTFSDKNRFKYKLEGLDEDWMDAGKQQDARYTKLEPGTYTFLLKGSNYDGVWNDKPLQVTITIHPPWWKTLWFRILLFVSILTAVALVYIWRVKAIQEQNRKLELLVMERTKELEDSNIELSAANDEIRRQNTILDKQAGDIELANTELEEHNQRLAGALHELKQTQTQLIQSEKMASLGQLTAGVAHEINNPVNFVSGAVKPLRRNVSAIIQIFRQYSNIRSEFLTPETLPVVKKSLEELELEREGLQIDTMVAQTDSLLNSIGEGALRIAEIVKGLRNFSRLDESERKKVNIHEGLDSTLTILQHQIKNFITVIKDYGDVPEIVCYPGQLNQVFMNIFVNAIQAMPSNRDHAEIRIKTLTVGNNLVIRIKDNGVGMPEEIRRKVFDPFFTTKDVGSGTGLGLSISFGIIEKHHGAIAVESAQGEGTEFSISLPIVS